MEIFKKIIRFLFGLLFVIGLGALFYIYFEQEKLREEKENLVWLARCELETLRNDREVQYLRLHNMVYEDGLLKLRYDASISSNEIAEMFRDSLMYKDFMSVIVLNPQKWRTISKYLTEAEVDLSITYSSHIESAFIISWKQLSQMLSDEQLFNEGMELFVQRKKQEVLNYAQSHFWNDRFFTVDSISLSKEYVSLHMSYDDSKANLGSSYLDTGRVSVHYTDKVGDMGSILNNMLSICVRTNKGFAFIYTAQKKRKIQKCQYNAKRAKKIYEDTANKLWLDKRETNQARTVIYRTK